MSKIPGKIPAMKSLSTSTCATNPYRIKGKLGGKSKPKLPDVVTSPSENFSE